MKQIQLTNRQVSIVDDADFEFLTQWQWYAQYDPKADTYYVRRWERLEGRTIWFIMHRILLDAPSHLQVDHINQNGLDNRRDNLRLCTQSQNLRNRRVQKNNLTGLKGVSYDPRCSLWRARITIDKKTISLGFFKSPEAASSAYSEAAIQYHKEFSIVNTIKKEEYAQ